MLKGVDDRRILSVLSVTTLAALLTGLNARLAVVGLPIIASELNANVDTILWIVQGYMIGSTIIQLIVGRLSDIYGRVRLFNLGFLIFIAAAIIAGFSPNPIVLILSRIIQGVGGAFLMTLSITILTDNIPRGRLATWLGVNQVAWRIGAIMGLSLSGFIIDLLGWRWLYLSYVPIGFIFYLWGVKTLKEVYKPIENPYIDKIGFILFTSFLSTLLISLTLFTFGSTYIYYAYILLLVSMIFLGLFVYWEFKIPFPALDFSLFKIWQFTGGIISQMLYSVGFGASSTLLVLYLEVVRRFSATWTGIAITPFEFSYLLFGLLGGRLSDRFGYVKITVIGLSASSIAFYLFSTMNMETDLNLVVLYQVLFGFGAGLFVAPNTSSIMTSVSQSKRGVASAIRSISFNIGFLLSLNLAIISMVQYVPYDVASKLIVAKGLSSGSGGYTLLDLANAISKSFLIQAIAMASAIPFSLSRGLKINGKL
ncbi:MAG: MFS transporter [Candidatus Methanomethylicia archaeon]